MKIPSTKKTDHILGFTLIELMIAVAVVGILAAIAYPSYTNFVLNSNRSEGERELLHLANLQEETFIDRRTYTADMTDLGMTDNPHVTEFGNYSIGGTTDNDGTTFILTATAQGAQVNDAGCTVLTVNEAGQKTPVACWR